MGVVGQRLVGLCLPPLLFALLDCTFTLVGQSAEYWAGDYRQVSELSPTFHHLLTLHPRAFVAGSVAWMAVFVGIILLLPDTLALIIAIAITFGHAGGCATWLLYRFQYSYQAVNALLLLAAIALGVGIRVGWQAHPPEAYRLPHGLFRWRWPLSALLFGIGVYLFLWPRVA